MNKKILFILGISLGLGGFASAQEVEDLARYSGLQYQGTARSTGAGNAFGAVGADYGALGINPAGLGLYRKSEFMFTAGFNETTTNSNYLGIDRTDKSDNFNIGNIGLVVAKPRFYKGKEIEDGWVSVNWAMGMNRTNNFYNNTVIEGTNTNNSIINSFRDDANKQGAKGIFPHRLGYGTVGFLGYDTYLVDPLSYVKNSDDSLHYTDATRHDNKINAYQRDIVKTSGATNAINLTFAGNYSNRFYIGGSISVPVLNYDFYRSFTEYNMNPINNSVNQYRSAQQIDSINTSGVGITASLGAIYRFSDFFRAGLSVQLPTMYSLTDKFSRTVTGVTKDNNLTDQAYNTDGFNYTLITPARITASGAFFFNKNGFLSIDYEYVDYASARINSSSSTFTDLNLRASNTLTGVNTVRIGGEIKINQFAIRAGYNYISSPYKADNTNSGFSDAYNIYSLGLGFRDRNSSFDLCYQYLQNNTTYLPYTLNDGTAPTANVSGSRGNLMLTYATRF